MSVVKVQFTRVENETEVNNTQIKDGQLLYTRDGKLYMDYGNARTKLTSIIELLTVASTAPSECSTGDMYYNTTTNLIYTATGTDTWGSTGSNPSTKYLYVDLTNAKLYYYDGVTFTSYGGGSVESDTEMSDSSTNPVQNKVIKEYVDDQIEIGNTEPTSENNKIWIDTGEIGSQASEITNEYSTSTGKGYSANYVNGINTYSETEHRVGTWIDGKPLYRKVVSGTMLPATTNGQYKMTTIQTNINDVDYIEIKSCNFIFNNDRRPLPTFTQSGYNAFCWIDTSGNLALRTNSVDFTGTVYATLEYTKTTD